MRTLKGRIQEPDSTRTQLRGDFRREKSLGGSKMRSNMRRNDRYHLQFTLKVERKNRKEKNEVTGDTHCCVCLTPRLC